MLGIKVFEKINAFEKNLTRIRSYVYKRGLFSVAGSLVLVLRRYNLLITVS